jgi:hypothetical protein
MTNRRFAMQRILPLSLIALALATLSQSAEAYIGPGAGISLLGAFWALIMAVVAAVGFVVWYPLRRVFRRRSRASRPAVTQRDERHEPHGERHPA